MKSVMTDAAVKAALNALKAEGGILEEPTLILLQAMPLEGNISRLTGMANMTEATFPGYAAEAALVFANAIKTPDDVYKLVAPSIDFVRNAGGESQMVHGYAIVNAAKTAVYRIVRFTNGVTLDEAGEGFTVVPEFVYGE